MRVRLADGRTLNVDTEDEAVAERAAQRFIQGERQRQTPQYQRARSREQQVRGGQHDIVNQMMFNVGVGDEIRGATSALGQGAENLVRRVQGRPIEVPMQVAGQAAADLFNEQGAQYAQEHPLRNAGSIAMSIPALGGAPAANAGRIGAVQAGLAAAGTNAPFALARQQGSLQERLPGAARETAVTGLFGAGLQAGANALIPRGMPQAAGRAAQFEQAGVRPSMAAISGGAQAGLTKMIGENFLAGGRVRSALQNSINDTRDAAGNVARAYASPQGREGAGEVVQNAIRRFSGNADRAGGRAGRDPRTPVRDMSFGAKSELLYDDVFERLGYDEAQMIGNMADGAPVISTDATERTLAAIRDSVSGPASREAMTSPVVNKIWDAISRDARSGQLRFQDLRRWRTWVRNAQTDEGLRQGIPAAELQRIEGALSEDIYRSADLIGGSAAQDLRKIDRWYRTISNRINTVLQPFVGKGNNPAAPASAFRRIVDLASQGGRQNSRALEQVRASLKPDEWRTVAASVIDEMGNPSFGNPNVLEPGAFSVEHFVTNYARLSPEGRQVLFGGRGSEALAAQLDNLAQVAGYQKGVERMVNGSRSGISVQNAGSFMGLANPGTMAPTAGVLTLGAITGEMLTNPGFVRWLVSAQRGGGVGGMRRHLGALAALAARDPALAPYYDALVQKFAGPERRPMPSRQPLERTQ